MKLLPTEFPFAQFYDNTFYYICLWDFKKFSWGLMKNFAFSLGIL